MKSLEQQEIDEIQQVNLELEAMKTIADTLKDFDEKQRTRIMTYIIERLQVSIPTDCY